MFLAIFRDSAALCITANLAANVSGGSTTAVIRVLA
jgi:hypothetical protein